MFLSQLIVNQGTHPDQPRPGLTWLRNTYSVHQRLWMAFPGEARVEEDPFFLGTWTKPSGEKRGRTSEGFLFRIEPDHPPRILVQSVLQPNWDYAFRNAPHLLSGPPRVREVDPSFEAGQKYRFRLVMQMVRRRSVPLAASVDGGKRRSEHPIRCLLPSPADTKEQKVDPALTAWRDRLGEAAEAAGFRVGRSPQSLRVAPVRNLRMKGAPGKVGDRFNAALFDGLITCTDPVLLKRALIQGVGRGKAFGMGLLSLAKIG